MVSGDTHRSCRYRRLAFVSDESGKRINLNAGKIPSLLRHHSDTHFRAGELT